MARLPRLIIPHFPHHVIQRGIHNQPLFQDDDDFRRFLGWLREGGRQFRVSIHAYVLMPDHFHLLVTPTSANGLGSLMQWLGRYYVPYFNQKYERTGTLWQGRYRTTVIEPEHYFLACSCYIELNPVRAGMVTAPQEYSWSSCRHHIGVQADPVVTDHPFYWALGNTPFEREAAYGRLIEQGLEIKETNAITEATLKGWALGSEKFLLVLEQQAQRRARPAKRGRPPKSNHAFTSPDR